MLLRAMIVMVTKWLQNVNQVVTQCNCYFASFTQFVMFCLHMEVACDCNVTAKLRVAEFLVTDVVKHLLLISGVDEKLNVTLCFRSLRNEAK